MPRRRLVSSGLPDRVYERYGTRRWRLWFQPPAGPQVTLFECQANDVTKSEARRRAKLSHMARFAGKPEAQVDPEDITFSRLGALYFAFQRALPDSDDGKKTRETLDENVREFSALSVVFGTMHPDRITPQLWAQYRDTRRTGLTPDGQPIMVRDRKGRSVPVRPAPAKVNKEVALASAILAWGREQGYCTQNHARGISSVPTKPLQRRVELAELDAVLAVARSAPGVGDHPASAHRLALAAKAAFLMTRRPDEIRALRWADVTREGVQVTAGKRRAGTAQRTTIMEWSPALEQVFREARELRLKAPGSCPYVFGSPRSNRPYSKSGWGKLWGNLMALCSNEIEGFSPFTLRDCRPGGVTEKLERGDDIERVRDGTLHSSTSMIQRVYDRRRKRTATPAA